MAEPSLQQLEAVIFDMDGVLIDARDWHYRALNDALGLFGATIPYDEHKARFDGLPTRDKLNILSAEGRLPVHLHQLVNDVKQERTLREAAALCFPAVEHLLLISWLKSHGLKIGVATNSMRGTSTAMLQFARILDQLDCLITNEDVQQAKPHPEIYLKACSTLNVSPMRSLVVEDNPVGVKAAIAAGCLVIKVDGPDRVGIPLIENFYDAIQHDWVRSLG